MSEDLRGSHDNCFEESSFVPDYGARRYSSRDPKHKSYLIDAPDYRFGRVESSRSRKERGLYDKSTLIS